ncbi:peptidase S45 penicillin amidase [Truepera radiovictrix DSM 17093]|uniref:Peptidase S45 penicillin amidase n=1 Tax=Truepera radiovictrix (strain DSM 17093 / CIP 108686 / LMG 22925 / RQ-24) TaxID=649638 RepID=D7CYD7_TRURR|nr:penicillin acylase family protein [Truepera radiovictrix]ADI14776.1 peptidase S45 penicillin amidase [Truepera radiovictrix DSM 17093]WMT56673.1 penicillin acylase family protein [Truepera radiovictrix]
MRVVTWTLALLLLLLLGAFFYLRTSLPQVRGTLTLPGLRAPVEVVRDRYAVPHIYAQSTEDALFALGFVHAQDRLFQMDFQRRVGAGRLSEVLGEATVDTDRFLRTLGVYRVAERTLPNLSAQARGALGAYTEGVNAFLTTRRGALPPEFLILGYEPEPWAPADSLVWMKMMAWDLGGNWDDELLRARLLRLLPPERVAELWPPYPGDAPVALPDFSALYRELPLDRLWAVSLKPLPPGAGSNNWVLSGARTATGAPLLANDPHLGLQAPALWYFAHLSAPDLEVIGATLPGLPFVVLGRTDRIAWGFTNTGPDVQDLFIERLDPDDPTRYETPGGFEPFEERLEVIRVRGQEDVVVRVRESRHGPVISDVVGAAEEVAAFSGEAYVLTLAWTALREDDRTFQAGLALNRARTWEDFVEALRDFHAPQQNIVYADIEGNIGLYAPGRVPIRASGDGLVPVPGWTGDYDWTGFIPFEELPHALNPPSGQLMTANHKLVGDDYPHFITHDWAEPYRAERIELLLAGQPQHTLGSFRAVQADVHSRMAAEFLPVLLTAPVEDAGARALQELLLRWDGEMAAERPEPLVFSEWYRSLTRLVFEDELGALFEDFWEFRPLLMRHVLARSERWCDDVRTPRRETCDELAARALTEASVRLRERYGADPDRWRWGEVHYADHDHLVFANTPLGRLFNLRIPNGGDAFTVNAARYALAREGAAQTSGPGYRALYDLSDLERSRFMHPTGQSGNVFSPFYRNLLSKWRDVEYLPMLTDRAAVAEGAVGTLRLEPAREE